MKYFLTENTVNYNGRRLYQIQALLSFELKRVEYDRYYFVEKGELGGYIEKEENLEQQGNCWITKDVYVMDDAKIKDNAFIDCKAIIANQSQVSWNAWIIDDKNLRNCKVKIFGNSKIYGETFIDSSNLTILKNAKIYGKSEIMFASLFITDNAVLQDGKVSSSDQGYISLRDNALVNGGILSGRCIISENAIIYDGRIQNGVHIFGNAKIYKANIEDEVQIGGNAEIKFDTKISGNAYICSNAIVERDEDVMTCFNIGTLALLPNEEIEGMQHLTFFRAGDQMQMTIGEHFYADPDQFLQHMKLFCQNLQATLEMAEKRFG